MTASKTEEGEPLLDDHRSPARRKKFEEYWHTIRRSATICDVSQVVLPGLHHRSLVLDASLLPTGSHYGPIMLGVLEDAERRGRIRPGEHVLVETSSGAAGASIAQLASDFGYSLIQFLPRGLPRARIEAVRGVMPKDGMSELRLSKGLYVHGAVEELRTFLANNRDHYRGRQLYPVDHSRRATSICALSGVLLHAMAGTTVDVGVSALGNGISAMAMRRVVQSSSQNGILVGFEPAEAPWFSYNKHGGECFRMRFGRDPAPVEHDLYGTGAWGVEFPLLDLGKVDEIRAVPRSMWTGMLSRLHRAGWPVGHTSACGQAVVAALAAQRRIPTTFLSIFYDSIERY